MTPKKNEKSNLEKKSVLFFQMGLVVALASLLVAFESGHSQLETTIISELPGEYDVPEDVIITRAKQPEIKPPATPVELLVIEDDEPLIDEGNFDFTAETTGDEIFNFTPFDIEDEVTVDDLPFVKVEKMPEYMGGDQNKFQKHLQQLVVYPEQAVEMGIEGRVFVNFVVDKNGKLTQANIVRSPDELLSSAVMDAIKKTKDWKPGEQRKRKVAVQFTVPVFFKLQ